MKPRVDAYGKVTVSLGGKCPLACRHCYTMTSSFVHDAYMSTEDVLRSLQALSDPFTTVCVSGDTDPFIDPQLGLELIQGIAMAFPSIDVMFTTRLIPTDEVIEKLISLGEEMAGSQRLLIPAVSFVSMTVPNFSERSKRIPSSYARLNLLSSFNRGGLPTLLALRPTFPFHLVPREEVEEIICRASDSTTVVLGEVFLLDEHGDLIRRMKLTTSEGNDRLAPMTFMEQPSHWTKRTFDEPTNFARHIAQREGLPYFLRSGSALRLLRSYWNFEDKRLKVGVLDRPLLPNVEPDP